MSLSFDFITLSPAILEILDLGKKVCVQINGISMTPLIYPNRDSVILKKITSELNVNDVVLVKDINGRFYLHRIFSIENELYTLNGDGEKVFQNNVKRENIVAIADSFIRKGRRITIFDKNYIRYVNVWRKLFPIRRFLLLFLRWL